MTIAYDSFAGSNRSDDAEIVTSSLRNHLPRTVVNAHSPSSQEVTLWVVGTSGLKEKRWTLSGKKWSTGFINRGNETAIARTGAPGAAPDTVAPSAWNPRLAMVASFASDNQARVRGAFAFTDRRNADKIGGPSLLGNPELGSAATYEWRRHNAQPGGFIPRTGFSWKSGTTERVNIFGTDAARQNLTELHFDGSNWHQSVHPKPSTFSGGMLLGTQSAIWDPVSGQGYVFVEVKRNDGADALDGIWCRYWNGSSWAWFDRGNPFHGSVKGYSAEGLVAVGYREASKFVIKLVMNGHTIDYGGGDAVFVQTIVDAPTSVPGSNYSWQQWKVPEGHRYTSGVAWERAGTRRINVFGHSADGKLLHFYMVGSTWAFGDTPMAPDGQVFRTDGSYVIEGGTYKRIAVVGRTATGRVYECFYSIDGGSESGWQWTDLAATPLPSLQARTIA
jgi:hypothetical protein